jgi:RNA polymerase sigma factor (sigma-70 family)
MSLLMFSLCVCVTTWGAGWFAWQRYMPAGDRVSWAGPRLHGMMSSRLDGGGGAPPSGGGGGRPPVDIRAKVVAPSMQAELRKWLHRLLIPSTHREDVAQDATLQALGSADTYDPAISRPERWFNGIAVNVAAHWHDLARHRREELRSDPPESATAEVPADVGLAAEQERQAVLEALQWVPSQLRAIVVAHDLDGISMTEVAERYHVPVSTAYKWRARGLAALADALRKLLG